MPRLEPEMVVRATGALMSGQAPEEPLLGVSSDTRTLEPGRLFVALAGPNFDGHDYVQRAFELGAGAALVRAGFNLPAMPSACLFQVEDTLTALGDLAAAWRREQEAVVAAITGSNGKTTTKEMLASILSVRHRVHKTQGNLNNLVGLPLTLLAMEESATACVVEMGMNAPGEIARLTEIAAPDVGLITNVGPAHIGMLGSMKAIALAKTELFRGLDASATAVVNIDDPLLAPWLKKLPCRVVSFGLSEKARVRGRDIAALGARQAFTLDLPGGEAARVRLALPGRHNVMNALGAAAAAWATGQGMEAISQGLESLAPVKGRLNITGRPGGPWVIDDSYNANPASLAAGLLALKDIAGGRRMALVLGDMRELGKQAAKLHRESGTLAVEMGCSLVLALGEQAAQVVKGARAAGLPAEAALAFGDQARMIEAARALLTENDVVLVKGSRALSMERVAAALLAGEVA